MNRVDKLLEKTFTFFTWITINLIFFILNACTVSTEQDVDAKEGNNTYPNIIFVLADDLGYGDVGCYGQKLIRTPHIDQLAREGMLFTQAYAGSTVCAPSRSVLMTGQHTGHTPVRGNFSIKNQRVPLPDSILTVAEILKKAGYTTGLFGKWGLGEPDTEGIPNAQGFDVFYGFLNQKKAHEYYPAYVWQNREQLFLEENTENRQNTYSASWYFDQLKSFIQSNKDTHFFAYLASQIPHDKYQLPVSELYQSEDWPENHKIYASMISLLDQQVGELMQLLKELHLEENTIVVFTSDNGPVQQMIQPNIFQSKGYLRGIKRDLYEGGIRVPMIVKWPAHIEAGTSSGYPWAFWDFLPTVSEIVDQAVPYPIDGVSVLPVWKGESLPQREYLYWEFLHEDEQTRGDLKVAVRVKDWKAVRNSIYDQIELYNLAEDPSESSNLASDFPQIISSMEAIMRKARTESEHWPVVK